MHGKGDISNGNIVGSIHGGSKFISPAITARNELPPDSIGYSALTSLIELLKTDLDLGIDQTYGGSTGEHALIGLLLATIAAIFGVAVAYNRDEA